MDKKFTDLKTEFQIYTFPSHFITRLKNAQGTSKWDDQNLKN
jgi:hypothetical protein